MKSILLALFLAACALPAVAQNPASLRLFKRDPKFFTALAPPPQYATNATTMLGMNTASAPPCTAGYSVLFYNSQIGGYQTCFAGGAFFNMLTASATSVNSVTIGASATGAAPSLASTGSDTNIGLTVNAKNTGTIVIGGTSTGTVSIGRGALAPALLSSTTTALGSVQSSTPTAAQLLGGIVTQASVTGAGTVTTPTGTVLSTAIPGVTVGDTFQCIFANIGTQTLTITAGASGMTIVGNAALLTLKNATLTFVNTAANTWICYVVISG